MNLAPLVDIDRLNRVGDSTVTKPFNTPVPSDDPSPVGEVDEPEGEEEVPLPVDGVGLLNGLSSYKSAMPFETLGRYAETLPDAPALLDPASRKEP